MPAGGPRRKQPANRDDRSTSVPEEKELWEEQSGYYQGSKKIRSDIARAGVRLKKRIAPEEKVFERARTETAAKDTSITSEESGGEVKQLSVEGIPSLMNIRRLFRNGRPTMKRSGRQLKGKTKGLPTLYQAGHHTLLNPRRVTASSRRNRYQT